MRLNWQLWSGVLPDDTIEKIIESAGETKPALIMNDTKPDLEFRSSKVSWLSDNTDILDMLYGFVDAANQNAFNVSLYKKAGIQFTEYHASENGHYDMHHDIDWNRDDGLDRKLSVTVQLSDPADYEGGEFTFQTTQNPDLELSKAKGSVLVFPSYLHHAVKPVTAGVRRSLVAWFEGPKWR